MSPKIRPPRWTGALLRLTLSERDAEWVLGDLDEEFYEEILPSRGPRAARRWYRHMALASIFARWFRRRAPGLPPVTVNPGHSWAAPWDALHADLAFAIRHLMRRPTLSVGLIGTLGLAIGATGAIFSVVDGVLLTPLSYPEPDRVMTLWQASREDPRALGLVSLPNFEDWRRDTRTLDRLATVRTTSLTLTDQGDPRLLEAARISDEFFEVFSVRTALGRGITREEATVSGPLAVLLGHGIWADALDGDPEILGRAVNLDGDIYRVVGVAPEGFSYPAGAQAWIGERISTESCGRGCVNVEVVGRTAPGTPPGDVHAEFERISEDLVRRFPALGDFQVHVRSLTDLQVGGVRRGIVLLLAAVGLVLLIACANVANLLLANAIERRQEMAVRFSLGAGRGRMIGQLMTESGVIATAGGLLGLTLAAWGVRLLQSAQGLGIPRLDEVTLSFEVVAFVALVTLTATLLFGVAPAVVTSRGGVIGHLRGRSAGRGGGNRGTARAGLIAAQIAVSVTLVLGTGLLLRTVRKLAAVDLGFQAAGVETFHLSIPSASYPDPDAAIRFFEQLGQRVSVIPGIDAVSGAAGVPLSGLSFFSSVRLLDRAAPEDGTGWSAGIRPALPGYFETLGIEVVRGRGFTEADGTSDPGVIVVSQRTADFFWPGEDPIGRQLRLSASVGMPERDRTVIGITVDVRQSSVRRPPVNEMYIPHAQSGGGFLTLVIRKTDPTGPSLSASVRQAVLEIDPDLPVVRESRLEEDVARDSAESRFYFWIFTAFATLALALAAHGLWGAVAYQVSARRQEIGIRMALGSQADEVVRMIARQGAATAITGLLIGFGVSLLGARVMQGLLFGVEPLDLGTWITTGLTLLTVAALATGLPAVRAARIPPGEALRAD